MELTKYKNKSEETAFNPNELQIHLPLPFWFQLQPCTALPFAALQYHDVKINLIFKKELDEEPLTKPAARTDPE
jgi:hypothetical protein